MSALSSMVMLGPNPSTYLLYDTFTDSDGTDLSSHTMDVGSGWTTVGGVHYEIRSNRAGASAAATTNTGIIHANAGQGDVSVSVSMPWGALAGGWYKGLCARASDIDNVWYIAENTEAYWISLVKRSSGTSTEVTHGPVNSPSDYTTFHTFSALLRDDVFVAYVDGVVQFTWIDGTFKTNTKFGLKGDRLDYSSSSWLWDDFKVVAAPAQTTYASDDFSEADGTSLSGKSLDVGGTWTVQSGTWTTSSGRAVKSGGSDDYQYVTTTTTSADVVVTATIRRTSPGTTLGIVGRYVSDTSHFLIMCLNATTFAIYERNSGSTLRASTSNTFTSGVDYALKAVFAGASISTSIDGGSVIAYHAAALNQSTAVFGLMSWDQTNNSINDFTVKSL